MRWVSHIAIAGSIAAVVDPRVVPFAVLGSTAPDWLEWFGALTGKRLKHRQETHYLVFWVALALFGFFVWDFYGAVAWFAIGGLVHVLCDALTVSGVPFGPWSDRRFHLFGGRLRTGAMGEYVIAGAFVLAAGIFINQFSARHGYSPFFPDWAARYESGLADAKEWKDNRFRWF